MNNNVDRKIKDLAEECRKSIINTYNNPSAKNKILKSDGNDDTIMSKLMIQRPINNIRISEDALKICLCNNVIPYDLFILPPQQIKNKYGNFFSSDAKDIDEAYKLGQYVIGDYNIPNKEMLIKMFDLCKKNPTASINKYRSILNEQSFDLITLEEKRKLDDNGLTNSGSKELRDSYCSPKIELTDLWLTPTNVIDKFFEITKLNKNECLDPCASDGRWLNGQGLSMDILPMKKNVMKQDFLTFTKKELPPEIKTIVGNLPFSLLDEFVNHSLELVDDCYFLVNGDTIFKHFPDNIKHIYIFTGLEGNQKDNRSRCEFDVPFLIKSALWCCIVHITKEKQPEWIIESNISNDKKRDGYHVALGKNVFIKSDVKVDKNKKITKIPVQSEISWKGGKKIIIDGETIDLKNFTYLNSKNTNC